MDAPVTCIARHVVLADRRYAPGERIDLDPVEAAALEASGAVERIDDPKPNPAPDSAPRGDAPDPAPNPAPDSAPRGDAPDPAPDSAPRGDAPDPAPDSAPRGDAPAPPVDPRPTTLVKGIGAKASQRLAELGVDSLGALAALAAEDDFARVAAGLVVVGDKRTVLTRWRDQARALVAAGQGDA